MSMLYVVGTPIGNLGDMTLRAQEVLKSVALIAAEDTRTSGVLMAKFGIDVPLVSYHKFNETQRAEELVACFKEDDFAMALITDAGMPAVSDPGAVLVAVARAVGATVVSVPAASAVTAAISVSGQKNDRFCFMGFFPRKDGERKEILQTVKKSFAANYVFYESPQRIKDCLKSIVKYYEKDAPVSVSKELTKLFEKTCTGTAFEVLQMLESDPESGRGEYVVIINNTLGFTSIESSEKSLESLLIETAVTKDIGIKEAVSLLRAENKNYKKSDLYQAAENVKNIIAKRS